MITVASKAPRLVLRKLLDMDYDVNYCSGLNGCTSSVTPRQSGSPATDQVAVSSVGFSFFETMGGRRLRPVSSRKAWAGVGPLSR